jgi:hypothetical protein
MTNKSFHQHTEWVVYHGWESVVVRVENEDWKTDLYQSAVMFQGGMSLGAGINPSPRSAVWLGASIDALPYGDGYRKLIAECTAAFDAGPCPAPRVKSPHVRYASASKLRVGASRDLGDVRVAARLAYTLPTGLNAGAWPLGGDVGVGYRF